MIESLSHQLFNKKTMEHHKEIKYSKSIRFKEENTSAITAGFSGMLIKK
jgi:hypothetical protein